MRINDHFEHIMSLSCTSDEAGVFLVEYAKKLKKFNGSTYEMLAYPKLSYKLNGDSYESFFIQVNGSIEMLKEIQATFYKD